MGKDEGGIYRNQRMMKQSFFSPLFQYTIPAHAEHLSAVLIYEFVCSSSATPRLIQCSGTSLLERLMLKQ